MFWSKPSGGPDAVGGIWPVDFPEVVCRNRSGGTHTKGEVAVLTFAPGRQAGAATEVATNDSNSYNPGFSNDTVWNTVVDPTSNSASNSTRIKGGLFCVCMSDSVADNATGLYKFFGLIEQAFCLRATPNVLHAGIPLSVTASNSFTGTFISNAAIMATYMDITPTTNTVRSLRRVLLHNGFLAVGAAPQA
jgi:hypothetical protein